MAKRARLSYLESQSPSRAYRPVKWGNSKNGGGVNKMRKLFYGVVTLVTLVFGLSFGSHQLIPRYETHNTIIKSKIYQDGSIRELYLLKRQYALADAVSKAIIRKNVINAVALHEFEMFPEDTLPADLPSDLRSWLGALED
jgi:hypothetical protein